MPRRKKTTTMMTVNEELECVKKREWLNKNKLSIVKRECIYNGVPPISYSVFKKIQCIIMLLCISPKLLGRFENYYISSSSSTRTSSTRAPPLFYENISIFLIRFHRSFFFCNVSLFFPRSLFFFIRFECCNFLFPKLPVPPRPRIALPSRVPFFLPNFSSVFLWHWQVSVLIISSFASSSSLKIFQFFVVSIFFSSSPA